MVSVKAIEKLQLKDKKKTTHTLQIEMAKSI
jgi:hypothetical protein